MCLIIEVNLCLESICFPLGHHQEEYPASQDLSNRCVNMIARLFHAPVNNPDDESLGVSTIGSSEGTFRPLRLRLLHALLIPCAHSHHPRHPRHEAKVAGRAKGSWKTALQPQHRYELCRSSLFVL